MLISQKFLEENTRAQLKLRIAYKKKIIKGKNPEVVGGAYLSKLLLLLNKSNALVI